MKRTLALVVLALALVLPRSAVAQIAQGTIQPTQQTATHADAAAAAGHSHTTATTITLLNTTTGYIYVTSLDVSNCATGTAVTAAAPTYITTTGLTGSPQYQVGSGVTAGQCTGVQTYTFGSGGLRSTSPGTNVTFVLPTFATNQVVSVNVYYNVGAPQ